MTAWHDGERTAAVASVTGHPDREDHVSTQPGGPPSPGEPGGAEAAAGWASPVPQPSQDPGPAWQPPGPGTSWQQPPGPGTAWQQPPGHPGPQSESGWGAPAATQWGAPSAPSGPEDAWRRVTVKPGIIPLRPMGLGEVYDGAFQAMRRNPRTMLGASAVINVVTTAIGLVILGLTTGSVGRLLDLGATPGFTIDESDVFGALGSAGLGLVGYSIVTAFGTALLTGVLTFAVGRAVLGEKLGPARLWTMVRPRLLAIIGLQLLVGLLYVVLAVVTLGPGVGLLFVEPWVGGVVLVLGVVVWAVSGIVLLVVSSMATPALLLEATSVAQALRRGWRIVRMAFWRTVGVMALTVALVYVLSTLLAAPASVLNLVFTALNPDDPRAVASVHPVQLLVTGLFSSVAATIVLPFLASVATLLYIDVRMRREGLDVELAAAAAGRP